MKIRYNVQTALQRFRIETLRKEQIEPINSILDGNDTFIVASTSSGKSLDYQLPAVMHENYLTVVIEPTMALMHDQVRKLKSLRIAAEYVDSTLCSTEKDMIWNDVHNHRVSILYISPERLSSPDFLDAIDVLDIYMVVVDECHCVLEWGISFRPDYLEIGKFIKNWKHRPIITALTATANPEDREIIQHLLGMENPKEFIYSIDRPNLILLKEEIPSYNDVEKIFQKKLARLKYNMKKYHCTGSMIIYCSTKRNVGAVYEQLKSKFPGEIVRCHSKMKPKTRAKHEREFLDGEKTIMIATSAFGMGIDKGDIDLIIHFDMPMSIGDYYQQAGRAGRDGGDAHCMMLYNEVDVKKWEALIKSEENSTTQKYMRKQLKQMRKFVESEECMMKNLLSYFGETKEKTCKHCTCCQRNRECKMCRDIKAGIHTYSLSHKTPYTEAQNLIELLEERGCCYQTRKKRGDYDGTYKSSLYADSGVGIYIYRYYLYSGFSTKITPCSLLKGSYAAENLYQPTSQDNEELMEKLDKILGDLEVKSDSDDLIRAYDMSVCRADPCINFYLDNNDEVLEYLRILKKSVLIPFYRVVRFNETSPGVKNIEEANNHSYRIKSKRAEFTAYDKIYQMQQNSYCTDEPKNTHILRLEVGLKRDALRKRLGKNEICTEEKILKVTARDTVKILTNYLRKMHVGTGDHLRYCDAEMAINNSKLGAKIKDRMLYLICKVSDSNLSSALEKLCKKYDLNKNQCERILDQFDALGISPITLRNDSKFSSLPSLISLLQEDQQSIPKRNKEGFIILKWKDPIPKKRHS